MKIFTITLGNLKRRKQRALLLLLSIIIGVASSVFLFTTTRSMEQDVADKIDQFGSNLLILPKTGETLSFGGVTVGTSSGKELDMAMVPEMKTIKNNETLATISPKLLAEAEIDSKKVLLVGVQFAEELRLKKWWTIDGLADGQLPKDDEILIGSEVARILNLSPQHEVEIKGEMFRVGGIIKPTGSMENDQAIFMDLPTLQKVEHKPTAISLIEAAVLCYTCPIEDVTLQLSEKLPDAKVTALQSTLEARDDTVAQFSLFATVISVILLITSGFVVAMSMISAVKERTRDIGVLRAIGFRKKHILRMFFYEVSLVGGLGGLMGFVLGMGLAMQFGSSLAQLTLQIPFQPMLALYSLVAALMISFLATIYPAWKATKLDPAEALRYF
ncbi:MULTISPECIES: FtsX-like permease family protein [Desulfitobacterium]|uniref:ABC-type transport system, involved in lipoprotein release, permease component n=1 Tax=Desulfitobacterium dehalogenans (strain ATCC 51507 / DSM 9161 / JW/IU-DC1) TaxID=756499 RepID=I4A6Y8_DESDJ|nr:MULTISPECIES: FtsX-like permease family protein [Desulfitobacterium]AFL99722.1 ABC-type transport system, involved in lipoprotein release, permease component [Desulfitobacterium dehalogenans ATCC 51507]